ncbi:MAG: pilus assembly protein PilM, partial [Planctomycetes bacterium]|nr:pilus assembly protein PilM [Planctomycetota bacterium]
STSTNSSPPHNQPLPQKSDEGIPQPQSNQVIWSVSDAIRGCVEALAHEINLCLRYCSVTFRGLRPDKITLMGGQAYDTELVKLMTEYLDTKCVIAQPLLGIDLSEIEAEADRRTELTEWSVATGLVLRNMINNTDVAQKYTSASAPASIANADNSDHLTADSISRGTNYASDKSN